MEKTLTGGYKCLPICKDCLEQGMTVVKHGKKNAVQEREEREEREREERAKKESLKIVVVHHEQTCASMSL